MRVKKVSIYIGRCDQPGRPFERLKVRNPAAKRREVIDSDPPWILSNRPLPTSFEERDHRFGRLAIPRSLLS